MSHQLHELCERFMPYAGEDACYTAHEAEPCCACVRNRKRLHLRRIGDAVAIWSAMARASSLDHALGPGCKGEDVGDAADDEPEDEEDDE